ncbi:hypothetical protein KKA15_03830 [Patescibacteria group bacterium]|nr:hypothetical protein [Patescibacteria group bacterium]
MPLFSSPVFSSKREIKEAIRTINSLDYKEREAVYDALEQELDGSGVSKEEYIEALRQLRKEHKISEIDRNYLLKLLDEQK